MSETYVAVQRCTIKKLKDYKKMRLLLILMATMILHAYPNAKTIIPGHGAYGGIELLNHTLTLVKAEKLRP